MKKWFFKAALAAGGLASAAALLVLGMWLGQRYHAGLAEYPTAPLPGVQATVLARAVNLPGFQLITHTKQPFTLANFNRQWTFLFFGYTYCPDICPTALLLLKDTYLELERRNQVNNAKVVFVSVDPQRDSPEQLAQYVPYYHPAFTGVTGDKTQIDALGQVLGVSYFVQTDGRAPDQYLIDHSADIYLIDPLGRLRALFPPPHDPAVIVADYLKIRDRYAEECCVPDAPTPNGDKPVP